MQPALALFLLRRIIRACLLVLAVASAAMLLVHLAPGDGITGTFRDPAQAAAERARLGLDRPFVEQYVSWLGRVVLLDFGESTRFHRPVTALLAERAGNTVLLGMCALALAIGIGIPAGVISGSTRRRPASSIVGAASLLLVATPPLVTALVLLLIASKTGWLPTGGLEGAWSLGAQGSLASVAPYLPLPALALGLPIAASLERLQSRAMHEALAEPCVAAAEARGVSRRRAVWRHALPLSLQPVIGVLGIVIGAVLSGSFVVEYVMSWPGLSLLMYDALVFRDTSLAAGCAAAGSMFLAIGLVLTDVALIVVDPRAAEHA